MICIIRGAFLGYKLDTMCLSGCINKLPVHPSTALTLWARLINNKRLHPRCFRTDVPRIELRWRRHCPCLPAWPRFPPPSLLQNWFSSGLGRPEHDVDHLSPSSADLRMGWSYTSDLPQYLNGYIMGWPLPLPLATRYLRSVFVMYLEQAACEIVSHCCRCTSRRSFCMYCSLNRRSVIKIHTSKCVHCVSICDKHTNSCAR
jgi:hypothetical protein